MPGRITRTGFVATTLVAGMLVACYQPPEPDCGFFCGSDGACPSDYTCGADQRCHLAGSPEGECTSEFGVATAQATFVTTVLVTFTDEPDPVSASDPANYAIDELSLSDTPQVVGNAVTLTTAQQLDQFYNLTVTNVVRLSDGQPIEQGSATFLGRTSFNLITATAPNANEVDLTFDAPPDPATVFCLNNYELPVEVMGAELDGSTVKLATTVQPGQEGTVDVYNILRASDGEPLSNNNVLLELNSPFYTTGASATDTQHVVISFSSPPNAASATELSNYVIDVFDGSGQLALTATPVLTTVSAELTTEPQLGVTYEIQVTGVTRGSDGELLETGANTATFEGVNHCTDGILDGNETAVDCGGPDCNPCAKGGTCLRDTDCVSGTCTIGTCQ